MVRRIDIDWHKSLPEWSNYDLDFVEEAIRVEKALRAASPKSGFLTACQHKTSGYTLQEM